MRAVLDPNVPTSALLSPAGAPARPVRAWLDGVFEPVVWRRLLDEPGRAPAFREIRRLGRLGEATAFVDLPGASATTAADPDPAWTIRLPDADDDHLIALARAERAPLVSGDAHLLGLEGPLP